MDEGKERGCNQYSDQGVSEQLDAGGLYHAPEEHLFHHCGRHGYDKQSEKQSGEGVGHHQCLSGRFRRGLYLSEYLLTCKVQAVVPLLQDGYERYRGKGKNHCPDAKTGGDLEIEV